MLHLSYFEKLKLKYSILEKSCDSIKGKSCQNLLKARIPPDVKKEAIALCSEIEAHKMFFSSFSEIACPCKEIREYYSSEEAFRYEVLEASVDAKENFIFICRDSRGRPVIVSDKKYVEIDQRLQPILAVDLCEHSYFLDYGFEKEEYLRRAIGHLDLSKITKK